MADKIINCECQSDDNGVPISYLFVYLFDADNGHNTQTTVIVDAKALRDPGDVSLAQSVADAKAAVIKNDWLASLVVTSLPPPTTILESVRDVVLPDVSELPADVVESSP